MVTALGATFTLRPVPGSRIDKTVDKDGYAFEKKIKLICESKKLNSIQTKVTLEGYCVHTPFKSKLYLNYTYDNTKFGEIVQRRLIFEKEA